MSWASSSEVTEETLPAVAAWRRFSRSAQSAPTDATVVVWLAVIAWSGLRRAEPSLCGARSAGPWSANTV